jgi:hypothetical protein
MDGFLKMSQSCDYQATVSVLIFPVNRDRTGQAEADHFERTMQA